VSLKNEIPVLSAGSYEGSLEQMISAFKDRQRTSLRKPLSELLNHLLLKAITDFAPDCYVLPPRNRRNFKKRGFDPIELIAKRTVLSQYRKLTAKAFRTITDQRDLDYQARLANLQNAIAIPPGSGRVLLVDDVMTSGATISELARAATLAGYRVVGACVLARTERQYSPRSPVF
jgi:predicted amidophosphoribosyltransferase